MANKMIAFMGLLLVPFNSFTQVDCFYNGEYFGYDLAQSDINAGRPRLLLSGGITPIIYTTDEEFEKKYQVKYFDFGCIAIPDECILAYNSEIFQHLDTTFGKEWRKEIRKDVIGLRKTPHNKPVNKSGRKSVN